MSCPNCTPDDYPQATNAPDPISPQHLSVRFGNAERVQMVLLDGQRLDGVCECMEGDNGWAITHDGKLCPTCRRAISQTIYNGRVTAIFREAEKLA